MDSTQLPWLRLVTFSHAFNTVWGKCYKNCFARNPQKQLVNCINAYCDCRFKTCVDSVAQPAQKFLGANLLMLSEQQYFVLDTASQNAKLQEMLET